MSRHFCSLLCLLVVHIGTAQTHFHVDQINVLPVAPTTSDNVSIVLSGYLSDTGAEVEVLGSSVMGNEVRIALTATSTGGLPVVVPHTETVELGELPAGDYTINLTEMSSGVMDSAPPTQHVFTVSGLSFPCEALDVQVQWAPFSDTAVVVHVQNDAQEIFDYPNFILFNAQGDTLAKEQVTFFGIGEDSWHALRLMDGITPPTGAFNGRLELWTNFTSTLACSWELTIDLCPPVGCHAIHPTMFNFGTGLTIGSFQWVIQDDGGLVALGVFELTDDLQQDADTVCLPAGHYLMSVVPITGPSEGSPAYHVTGPGFIATQTRPVLWSPAEPLDLLLYPYCVDTPEAIAQAAIGTLRIAPGIDGIWVSSTDGQALGMLHLMDAQGRPVRIINASSDLQHIPVETPGIYVVRAGMHVAKVLVGR